MNAILTKMEVAKKLRVSERTVDNLRKHQGLPYATVGRSIRFAEEDVDAWLRGQSTVEPGCDALSESEGNQAIRGKN